MKIKDSKKTKCNEKHHLMKLPKIDSTVRTWILVSPNPPTIKIINIYTVRSIRPPTSPNPAPGCAYSCNLHPSESLAPNAAGRFPPPRGRSGRCSADQTARCKAGRGSTRPRSSPPHRPAPGDLPTQIQRPRNLQHCTPGDLSETWGVFTA